MVRRARPVPVRTCIGCRQRSSVSELLRVVVVQGVLVPDPRRRLPGRGASVHLDPVCLDLAERRRAFGRALRSAGPLEAAPVREYVTEHVRVVAGPRVHGHPARAPEPEGRSTADEHSMKRQR